MVRSSKSRVLSYVLIVTLIFTSLFGFSGLSFADGASYVENFTGHDLGASYVDGQFTGVNDVTWSYVASRNVDTYGIDGEGIILRRLSNSSKITSSTIENGLGTVSFKYRKAYTGTAKRTLELYVNGTLFGTTPEFGTDSGAVETVYTFDAVVATSAAAVIEIRNMSEGQITVDDITWTEFSGDVAPRDTAYGVTSSVKEGAYPEGKQIELKTTEVDGKIYYTLDGSEPTTESTLYSEPFTLSSELTIKAITVKEGFKNSPVSEFKFTIKPPTTLSDISVLRNLFAAMEANVKVEDEYAVEGVVTAILGSGNSIFVQDSTGGVVVRIPSKVADLAVGNTVKATGTLENFNSLGQLNVSDIVNFQVTDSTVKNVDASIVTLADVNEAVEGSLITIKELEVTADASGTGNYNVNVVDLSGNQGLLRVEKTVPTTAFKKGDVLDVTGVVGQYSKDKATGYQIFPRSEADVVKSVIVDEIAPEVSNIEVNGGNIINDVKITANVTDNRKVSSVELNYRVKGTEELKTIPMVIVDGKYTAVIPKSQLTVDGIEYKIIAKDGINTTTSDNGEGGFLFFAISAEDISGPEFTTLIPADGAVIATPDNAFGYRAEFQDPAGIDETSVKMFVNDVDVTTSATYKDNAISYKPDGTVENGDYKIKVIVKDTKGNESVKVWNITVGKRNYNFYYGQLHSHTTLSDGQGTVDEAYTWARDKGNADFFAVTDHSNWFDNDLDWTKSASWKTLKDTADKYNKDGEFAAIAGYEMTWSGSTGGWGHINTFNTEWFETRTNKDMDLKAYYKRISESPDSISQLNHPGKTFGDFSDFGFYSKAADDVVYLVEVGNGEGPIRGSGYFPSYEYYTRALDKGWHVAPSNNQDNHKAGWITANEARTVVVAEILNRENIYNGIKKLNVYSTEDSNLEVMYKVNGQLMGAQLSEPKSLDITIDVKDPDEGDNIKKISIIADGGVVVDSKEFDSNTATWNLSLDPMYTYYYVRVDQEDKDIAVTAPVWAGSVVMIGLSNVSVEQDPMVIGTQNTIRAKVYNNSELPLMDQKVEFFANSISPENKIGEEILSTIMPSSEAISSITWTPKADGEIKIYAKMTSSVDGTEKVFTVSTSVLVGKEGELPKIVLDTAHFNQYVSGDYAGKMETLKALCKDNRYMLVESKTALTKEMLSDASILIITDPASADKDPIKKSLFSDDEIEAIKAFAANGGSIIVTSKADYGDADGDYGNAAQANKILEAIGSNMRLNDDQVIDNTENGGQAYRLYFSNYPESQYKLTSGVPSTDKYSFYSGNSVILANGGDNSKVDWFVKGHSTTESSDADKKGDNTPVTKGDVNAIGAEVLPSGAKLIAAGSTFFSDFETATNDNSYSNRQITMNALKWMINVNKAPKKTIAEVRIDSDKDGNPDLLGEKFTIEGYITAQSEAVTPKNSFFEVIYVQDATGGITVFGVSSTKLPLGTKVRITGTVGEYEEDSQLALTDESSQVVVLSEPINIIDPKYVTTKDSMLEETEGLLVGIQGKVTKIVTDNGDNAIYLDDGTGEARVYLNGYISDSNGTESKKGKWDQNIKVGDTVRAIGLSSQDMVGHRLRVRNVDEIVLVKHDDGVNTTPLALAKNLEKGTEIITDVVVTSVPGKLGGSSVFVADATGASYIHKLAFEGVKVEVGAKLRITAKTDLYNGVFQLVASKAEVLGTDVVPETKIIKTLTGAEAYESARVTLKNVKVTDVATDSYKNSTIKFLVGDAEFSAKLDSRSDDNYDKVSAMIGKDSVIDISGFVTENNGTYSLKMTGASDITVISKPESSIKLADLKLMDALGNKIDKVSKNSFVSIGVKTSNSTDNKGVKGTIIFKISQDGNPNRIGFINNATSDNGDFGLGFDVNGMAPGKYKINVYYWEGLDKMTPITEGIESEFVIE